MSRDNLGGSATSRARVCAWAGNTGRRKEKKEERRREKEKDKKKGEKEKKGKRRKRKGDAGGIRGDGREHAMALAERDARGTRRREMRR